MKAKIKSLHLENFKGVKSATYQFDGKNVSAIGQNGAGKTTLFTAYMWIMADKDSDLKSNPNIRPLDTEECTPRVEVVFDIDGKEITAAKIQKCTVKKSKTGGADTVSLSNSYEVNSVEYGERDFKKKMSEYGFDFDLFLPLSHPDVFTSQKSADMRKVLFSMASEQSDYEIAVDMDGLKYDYNLLTKEEKEKTSFEEFIEEEISNSGTCEVGKLLKNHTAEEVKAMQNATLHKIREDYGKDGEILRAKIEGMEQSKTDIDVAELELQKNALNEQIAENKAKQEDISKEFEEQQKASDGILELKFELNDLQRKANEENNKKRLQIQNELDKANSDYDMYEAYESGTRSRIKRDAEKELPLLEQRLKEKQELWKSVKSEQIDEDKYICPTCHRELPEEEKENILSNFEETKKQRLEFIVAEGEKASQAVKDKKKYIEESKKEAEEYEKKQEETMKRIKELEKQLSELPESIDISDCPEVQEIQRQIAKKEQAMNKGNSAEEVRLLLKANVEHFQEELTEVEKQLALAQKNVEIDEQIAALRKKQSEFEQNKANAEKILYQLDLVSKRKNELLTDQVNSHFKLVKFRLFDYLKNGNVVDDCEPTIDGKSLKDHSNGALRVLAKLDIVDGLQRFYGQNYPVFAEDFSLVTDNTECRIDMDCQLIKLVAEKGVKELKIEVED